MDEARTSRAREYGVIAVATLLFILARAIALHAHSAAHENPLLTDHDVPHYAAILVSAETGVSFARDAIFAGRAALVWKASSAYMGLFRVLLELAGHDFGTALDLFQILLLAIYFPAMVAFLRAIGSSLPVALAVSAVSAVSSSFLVTGTRWGILTPVVPLVLCTAIAPLLAFAALRMMPRHAILTGTLLSIPLVLINPATGMALIELALILAFIATLRREIPWKAFAALLLTAAFWTIVARYNIGARTTAFSFADAAEMIRYGQDYVMVFPFRGALPHAASVIGGVLAIHALLSIVLFALRSRRVCLAALIVVQALYAMFFLRAGWLMLLPLVVSLDDIRRDRFKTIDGWLWFAFGISIAIGPLQQTALLAAWQRTRIGALTPLVFEGARFLQFAYLFVYALVARSIDSMQQSFATAWFRAAVVAFVAYGVYLNLDVVPFPIGPPRIGMVWIGTISLLWLTRERWLRWFLPEGSEADGVDRERAATALLFGAATGLGVFLVLFRLDIVSIRVPIAAAAGAALVIFAMGESKRDSRAFVAACAFAAIIGGPWMLLLLRERVRSRSGVAHETLGFAIKLPRAERNRPPKRSECDPQTLSDDFKGMTEFIRTRLPATAVLHVMTFDRSFRAYARRAMLPVSDEWIIPIYDGAPVGQLRQESAALWQARENVALSRELAATFGADYLVTCGPLGPGGAPLFARGRYAIYSLK